MTRFLADENIPAPAVRALRAAGVDVIAVADLIPGASDGQILATAREQERILLTFDRDMGTLIFKNRAAAPPGIVLIRNIPPRLSDAVDFIVSLVQRQDLGFDGRFTVVTRERVRQRPLPRG